jgi:tetratricopeptide (TPR) repeat protein
MKFALNFCAQPIETMKFFFAHCRLSLPSLLIFAALFICLSGISQNTYAQTASSTPSPTEVARLKAALTLENVMKGLQSEKATMPEKNRLLMAAVRDRGIAFAMTDETETKLSELGASKALLDAITKEAKKFQDVTIYYVNLGDTFRIQKNYDEAIANYTKAIDVDPSNRTAFNQRGRIYKTLGDNLKKEKNFEEANKNYEKCIADSTEYIRIDPTGRNGYNLRGSCYYEKWTNNNREESLANGEKAITDFTDAIARDPKFIEAYQNRADTYRYTLGKKEKADADEQKIKDIRSGVAQP